MKVEGTVQLYDNVRRLLGAGLDFRRQEFFMMVCGPGYIFAGNHMELSEVTDEVEATGYKRELVKFDWEDWGAEMKLTFTPITFRSGGTAFRAARWVIYRALGTGALLFSGQIGPGDITMTEGDELEIAPESSGILRLN